MGNGRKDRSSNTARHVRAAYRHQRSRENTLARSRVFQRHQSAQRIPRVSNQASTTDQVGSTSIRFSIREHKEKCQHAKTNFLRDGTLVVTEHERTGNHCPKTTSSASVHDMVTGSCNTASSEVLAARSNAPDPTSLSAGSGRRNRAQRQRNLDSWTP